MKLSDIGRFVSVCLVLSASLAVAEDWPQWLGSNRDSVWRESGIRTTFPDQLTPLWRVPVAYGYAGPAVADGRVYVMDYVIEDGKIVNNPGQRVSLKGRERLTCVDASNGRVVWRYEYACPYQLSFPAGPRATPTISDGKVYALGAMGDLHCVDAETGERVWAKDLKTEYDAPVPIWGFASHPLVDGDRLYTLAGGRGSVAICLDKQTGRELWRSLSAREIGYCPPVMIQAGGVRQLIIWHAEAINGLDPETGEVYWSVPLSPSYGMSIATPRQYGDYLFASGIGNAGVLLKLDATAPKVDVVWRGESRSAVYCANSSPFIDGDVLYGVDRQGELRGIDLLTGKRLWETFAATTGDRRAAYATAFLIKQSDGFLLYNDQGDLIRARLTREGYQEVDRVHILEPTNEAMRRPVVWSHPAFANRCIYARNDKELVCVSLAAER